MIPAELTQSQFNTVYNFLSLVIAAQLFTTIFLLASQKRVLPRYRQALVISATVTGIAAYHYFRIFNSFTAAFVLGLLRCEARQAILRKACETASAVCAQSGAVPARV